MKFFVTKTGFLAGIFALTGTVYAPVYSPGVAERIIKNALMEKQKTGTIKNLEQFKQAFQDLPKMSKENYQEDYEEAIARKKPTILPITIETISGLNPKEITPVITTPKEIVTMVAKKERLQTLKKEAEKLQEKQESLDKEALAKKNLEIERLTKELDEDRLNPVMQMGVPSAPVEDKVELQKEKQEKEPTKKEDDDLPPLEEELQPKKTLKEAKEEGKGCTSVIVHNSLGRDMYAAIYKLNTTKDLGSTLTKGQYSTPIRIPQQMYMPICTTWSTINKSFSLLFLDKGQSFSDFYQASSIEEFQKKGCVALQKEHIEHKKIIEVTKSMIENNGMQKNTKKKRN